MSDKLMKKVKENQSVAEESISTMISTSNQNAVTQTRLLRLGAVGAVGRIAQNLSAQTIRALQNVRDGKDFEALGFTRFDDFLDESEYSPMSYRQFNDREKLLQQEGEQLFDLYNNLNLSQKRRRLLGAGNVQIDDAKGIVTVITGEDTEVEIELTDRTRLLQTLSALADQSTVLNGKITKQKDKIERGEKEIVDLRKKLDDAEKRPGTVKIIDVWMTITSQIRLMTEMVKKSSEKEKHGGKLYVERIEYDLDDLKKAYGSELLDMSEENLKHFGKKLKNVSGDASEDNEFAGVTASMNDDELAGLMD